MPRFIVYGRTACTGQRAMLCSVEAKAPRQAMRLAAKRLPGTRDLEAVLYSEATESVRQQVDAIERELKDLERYFDGLADTGSAG